jgi:hypothetical protein
MSKSDKKENVFDPTGMMQSFRDAGMDNWAKVMTQFVNTDAYAEANAEMLNAWLSSSSPFRQAVEKAMGEALSTLNLPSRDDVTRLAERLTHIEMKLDDIDARFDAMQKAANSSPESEKRE